MKSHENQLFTQRLAELAQFVETAESLEQGVHEIARMVSEAMACSHCSIMLIKKRGDDEPPTLRVEAHHGDLPSEALHAQVSLDSGISGHVASMGKPLLIQDLHHSPFAPAARREPSGCDDVISVPIMLEDTVVGVINIDTPQGRDRLDTDDLNMATVLAFAVAQSLRIHRLQGLLKATFMQSILARVPTESGKGAARPIHSDPDRLARVIAHTLFREMKRVGFAGDHILGLANELISRVCDHLSRSPEVGPR